jgi:translation initiation factor IF-2
MSGKKRVYEIARDLEMDNKALLAVLKSLDVPDVKNHMSVLSVDDEARVMRHMGKAGDSGDSDAASRPRVVKRRAAVRRATSGDEAEATKESEATPEVRAPIAPPIEAKLPSAAPTPAESIVSETVAAASSLDDAWKEGVTSRTPFERSAAGEVEQTKSASSSAPDAVSSEREAPTSSVGPVPSDAGSQGSPVEPAKAKEASVLSAENASEPEGHSTRSASLPLADADETAVPVAVSPAPAAVRPVAVKPAATPVAARPAAAPASSTPAAAAPASTAPPADAGAARPSSPPKRGIDVWEGRPGVPMHNHRPGPRRVQYDAKAPVGAGAARRGPGGRMMRTRQRGIGSFSKGRGGAPVTKERSAHKKVVRIEETVTLQTLAGNMGIKTGDMLRKLFQLGMSGININSTLDADTAKIIGSEFGWDVEDVAVSEAEQLQKAQGTTEVADNPEDLRPRPPVITVMGHVDHGKTSLLDAIRLSQVAHGEAGGITQHIGAYSVTTPAGMVTFLDTPGHAAFTAMRSRGTKSTDIVVLVVAADDGVMPQTKEAIQHAKAAGVPILVAINKCDKPEAQPERVRRELSENGLVPEEWGGDTLFCEVSAHTKVGLPELLERLALQAEVMELRANPDKPASGVVIESQLDRGRGPVATILVKDGTLKKGDVVLAGASYGKVRAMQDWAGKPLKEVKPSEPVALVGLSEVPRAGDYVYVVKDLKTAQAIAETRKVKERRNLASSAGNKPRTLEEIAQLMSETEQLELKVIVKADVVGSAEAVSESLVQLSTEKVRVSVVLQAAGAITENDVNLAVAAGGIIVGFNVKPAGKAASVAQREGIEIRQYSIIYRLLDDVRLAMEGMLAPKLVERPLGKAQVRQTFRISKTGTIAGCMVVEGAIRRGAGARLFRAGEQIWEGKVSGLKRFKEDVREVKDGFECGISLENMDAVHVDDEIHVFEMEEVKQSL